jgi:hypothetical protein
MAVVTVRPAPALAARVAIVSLWSVALGTVCLVYAVKDQNAECNVPHHRMGLDLSDFLLWFGVAHFVALVTALVGLCVLSPHDGVRAVGLASVVVSLAVTLFLLAWSVVGAIILFQDCLPCIAQQDAVGIVALVVLILHWAATPLSLSCSITCDAAPDDQDGQC